MIYLLSNKIELDNKNENVKQANKQPQSKIATILQPDK